ncbi:membrane protein [Mycobacterium phage MeaningOfLife]|nr:membrane protein [Mycobacterium phage MeaningOfLife]
MVYSCGSFIVGPPPAFPERVAMSIAVAFIVLRWIVCVVALAAVLLRWRSFRILHEGLLTSALLLQLLGAALCGTVASMTLGRTIYQAIGVWHLEDWLGRTLYLFSAGAIAVSMLHRVCDDDEVRVFFARWVAPWLYLTPVVTLALQVSSPALREPSVHHNMLDMPATDIGIVGATALHYYATMHLLAVAVTCLWHIAHDEHQGRTAVLWIIALAFCIACCGLAVASAFMTTQHAITAMISVCGYVTTVMLSACLAWSWWTKIRPYRGLIRATRTSRRALRDDTAEAHRRRLRPDTEREAA